MAASVAASVMVHQAAAALPGGSNNNNNSIGRSNAGGKQIYSGIPIPYNFALKRYPASEVCWTIYGQISLENASLKEATGQCKLEGRGVTFRDIQCNPFTESFYKLFYPDATGCDLFYRLEVSCEKTNNKQSLYISSEVRFTLCMIDNAIAAAKSVIHQSHSNSKVTKYEGNFFSMGKHTKVETNNTVHFSSKHLGMRSHCFVLRSGTDELHKLLLFVYKYSSGEDDFLIELKYIKTRPGECEEDYEYAHCYASLALPMSIYLELVNLHECFKMVEQGYFQHTKQRSLMSSAAVAAAPVAVALPEETPPIMFQLSIPQETEVVTSAAATAASLFEDDRFSDLLNTMQQQDEINFMHNAAKNKKRSRKQQ